ncbi:response regulator [Deinococcus hohokamensis]|uniref:Response regulator n=1 Tax=Deinococcus hohokamensis TaxID=309883 RepID=A0ABV9I960_9DEIO
MSFRLHILLVEDSTSDLVLAQDVFSLHQDRIHLTMRTSAADALAYLNDPASPRTDVILMDLHLPGMSGLEALAAIKHSPELSAVPVILMSGTGDPAQVRQAYALHASAFLAKDIRFPQQLTAFLKFWLQARVPAQATNSGSEQT